MKIIGFFLLLVCLFFCKNPYKSAPQAIKGVLNLRPVPKTHSTTPWIKSKEFLNEVKPWDFEKDGSLNLNGEWEFYWNEFVPLSTNYHSLSTNYIHVPSQWQKHGYPREGYATYRLRVLLSDSISNLSIAMTDAGSSYQMYINGIKVSENGKIGKSREESEPFRRFSNFPIRSDTDELDIIIYVSNFHNHQAGLWNTITLGSTIEIERKAKKNFVIDLIVFSSLLIMGLYHLGLYVNRKKDIAPLYFGLLSLIIALRTISVNERIVMDAFLISFRTVHKIDFLTIYCAPFLFIQFLRSLFPAEYSKKVFITFVCIYAPCILTVIVLPMEIYRKTLSVIHLSILTGIVYDIFVLGLAIVHKRESAKVFLAGFLLFGFTIANDILIGMGFLSTPYLSSFGLVTFMLFQAVILARRFAKGFEMAEELSERLEHKVIERTIHLEEAKAEIEKIAESRKKLSIVGQKVAAIVHDLKNPISTIKAFAEMANTDAISREEREEFLTTIVREIDRLGNLAYDILDFSKNEITLELSEVNLTEFLEDLYQFLKIDFEYANIVLNVKSNYTGTVVMDRERMRRVLINMANNAREAMQESRKDYTFSIEAFLEKDFIIFTLSDNGKGLSASIEEKIFEAFATEGKAKGTGLGLYMCKIIVDAHGGELSYTTKLGKGTTFFIKNPIRWERT